MTDTLALFDVKPTTRPRPKKPLPKGVQRPTWTKYAPKVPQRCDDCTVAALESLTGRTPFSGIAQARWSRRQDNQTRLYCNPHQQVQRAEDRAMYSAAEGGAVPQWIEDES